MTENEPTTSTGEDLGALLRDLTDNGFVYEDAVQIVFSYAREHASQGVVSYTVRAEKAVAA